MLYRLLKYFIHSCLYFYLKEIQVYGLENIPKNKPVLFLPNHQNALIDVLLVAVDCNRSPYFLARSDVFGKPFLNLFFKYIKMIPIYRIRDGRNSLFKNDEVFDICAQLLSKGESVVMFPEGNHSLKRRVRPLSKGFTRLLFRALEKSPDLDMQIVPVGLNYKHAEKFPDSVAVYYGKPIAVQHLYHKEDLLHSATQIKDAVTSSLKTLTTHTSPEVHYKEIISHLKSKDVDFLNPKKSNQLINAWLLNETNAIDKINQSDITGSIFKNVLSFLNLPVVLCWRFLVRPKVTEPEFMSTFRFATSVLLFPIYFIIIFLLCYVTFNLWLASGFTGILIVFNWCCVKWLVS